MSSRSPGNAGRLAALAALLMLAGCERREATQAASVPAAASGNTTVATTTLFPGGGSAPPENPVGKLYEGNAEHIAAGRRYYGWYNCAGCHFNGGGGIGPALMDDQWIYGDRIDQIYDTLLEGRPNGMPSWRGKIPDEQLWQISAYVKSMSADNAALGKAGDTQTPTAPPAPVEPKPATTSGTTVPAKP